MFVLLSNVVVFRQKIGKKLQLLFFLSSQDRWVDVKRGKEIQWQMGVCMCVCERSVWTLIAAQALMVRAQLCDSAEYWSPSNFSWSEPSQPARQYRTRTHTLTRVHSADFRSRSWNGTQVNTDRISKMHKLLVSALASDWLMGLIVSDWSVGVFFSKPLTSSIELRWATRLHHFWCAISFLSDQN